METSKPTAAKNLVGLDFKLDCEATEWLRRNIRQGVTDGFYHHLLPRHDVYLFSPPRVDGGSRFATLFRAAWKRMPLYARRRILKHWRTAPFVEHLIILPPTIELLDDWSSRVPGRRLRGDLAECSRSGCQLRFWSRIVAAMPDALVCDLIAHELAPVYQWGIGWNLTEEDNYIVEEDADCLVEHWGFRGDGIDEWARAKGITKVIDQDELSPRQRRRYWAKIKRAGR